MNYHFIFTRNNIKKKNSQRGQIFNAGKPALAEVFADARAATARALCFIIMNPVRSIRGPIHTQKSCSRDGAQLGLSRAMTDAVCGGFCSEVMLPVCAGNQG